MADVPPLTVTQLASAVDGVLRESFPYVAVVGEVGKATPHSNGHFYFDLKDDGAVISCVMWRGQVARMGGDLPRMGDAVVVHGEITTYKMRGTYQVQVFKVEPVGLGTLLQQVAALKAKLDAEGLFDAGRKKRLPFLPRKVGIITSPTGAVIQDMLSRFAARCPVPVVLWPATVQGAGAAAEIVAAVEGFNRLQGDARPDVVIVARGGGSMEDLMPFNDERVVRAVAASDIPIVSGVGHEPDTTLIDYAADVRAETPTAAAERVVPVRVEVLSALEHRGVALTRVLLGQLERAKTRVGYAGRLLPSPTRLLAQALQRLDDVGGRLVRAGQGLVEAREARLVALGRVLEAHRPLAPLERGFALVRDEAGRVVCRADAGAGPVVIQFADGTRKGALL